VVATSLMPLLMARAASAAVPRLITYGHQTPVAEGDDDHVQVVLVKLPVSRTEPVAIRVFDPDCGGAHDELFGVFDTTTRFSVYGGEGAATGAGGRSAISGSSALEGGRLLTASTFGPNDGGDGAWTTLAMVDPADGELVGDSRWFRIVVEGLDGNDGNVYDLRVTRSSNSEAPVESAMLLSPAPTVRLAEGDSRIELWLNLPAANDAITVREFDAAGAGLTLETVARSLAVASSGDGTSRDTRLQLLELERGRPAALAFGGDGTESPNDATFAVLDSEGAPLLIELPPHLGAANRRPVAALTTEALADCLSVGFDASGSRDPDGGGLETTFWLGDGTVGHGDVVTHRYPAPGGYDVVALVTDRSGNPASGTVVRRTVVVNQRPVAVAGADQLAAPGEAVPLDGSASSDGDGRIVSWRWKVATDTKLDGVRTRHAWSTPGRYTVELRIDDDSNTPCGWSTDSLQVWINAAPRADAGGDTDVLLGDPVAFDAGRSRDSDGRIVGYAWDLGDDHHSTETSFSHVYTSAGRYRVSLEVEDDAGASNSRATDTRWVTVNAPPIADAGADRRVAVGEVLELVGSGSSDPDGQVTDFRWDLGDGATATGAVVPYAWSEPGRYQVKLTVSDDAVSATGTGDDTVTVVVNAPPVAAAGPDQRVTAGEIVFDGSASHDPDGSLIAHRWDLGDGTSLEGAVVHHVYPHPGRYGVVLTVEDDSGTLSSRSRDTMTVVVNQRPIADAGPDLRAAPGEPVRLDGSASSDPDGAISQFQWILGGDSVAAGADATHSWSRPGTYTVLLEVHDDSGDAEAIDYDSAAVTVNVAPIANAGSDARIAPGTTMTFDGSRSLDPDGAIIASTWRFSDGVELAGPIVQREFSEAGTYRAVLDVTDDSGVANATSSDAVTILVNHPPHAVPGMDVVTCQPTVTLDATDSADADGDPLNFVWSLGDGAVAEGGRVVHTYAEPGVYPVTVTVDDGTGLSNASAIAATTVSINQPPVAVAGDDVLTCAGDTVLLDGSGSIDPDHGALRYRWQFSDGDSSDVINPARSFDHSGVVMATLTVEDDSGLACGSDSDSLVIHVAGGPVANAGDDQTVCANTAVRFDGSKSTDFDGVVNAYKWTFGDGASGDGEKVEHTYSEPGEYAALLTVTGDRVGDCSNTDSDDITIRVLPAPEARIEGPSVTAVGADTTLVGVASFAGGWSTSQWSWDLGDGSEIAGPNVHHAWSEPGSYTVTATVTDGGRNACWTVTVRHSVVVNQAPTAVAGDDLRIAIHEAVELDGSASKDDDGAIVSYRWDFGDGASSEGRTVRHRYVEAGVYTVSLSVTDDAGTSNSTAVDRLEVTVEAPPTLAIDGPERACVGYPTEFAAADDVGDGAARFTWMFDAGETSDGRQIEHVFTRPGTHQVGLVVDDGSGLANARNQTTKTIDVSLPLKIDSGPDRLVCADETVTFNGIASADPSAESLTLRWTFGDGATAVGSQTTHAWSRPGRYVVALEADDGHGTQCSVATDTARVRVNSPPTADAGPDREAWSGGANDVLTLDGAASSDPDGDPLTYTWDFGDGSSTTGQRVIHGWRSPGDYTVRLTVSDGTATACGEGRDEIRVTVRPRTGDR
jgi:PKD repeat protein